MRDALAQGVLEKDLIRANYEAIPNTIVGLIWRIPYAIRRSQERVPAIIHVAHGGQDRGSALADVLFGDVNPAGRLTMNWPKTLDQLPDLLEYDIRHGRTYMYLEEEPLYPFGHGLSHSTLGYHILRPDQESIPADGMMTVSVDVTNSNDRAGNKVVHLDANHLTSQVERPCQELQCFQRLQLESAETRTVALPLAGELGRHGAALDSRIEYRRDQGWCFRCHRRVDA